MTFWDEHDAVSPEEVAEYETKLREHQERKMRMTLATDRSRPMKTTVLREASPLTDEYVATAEVNVEHFRRVTCLVEFEKGKSHGCFIQAEFSLDGENWYVQSVADNDSLKPVERYLKNSIKTMFILFVEEASSLMRLKAKASSDWAEGTLLKLSVIQ